MLIVKYGNMLINFKNQIIKIESYKPGGPARPSSPLSPWDPCNGV